MWGSDAPHLPYDKNTEYFLCQKAYFSMGNWLGDLFSGEKSGEYGKIWAVLFFSTFMALMLHFLRSDRILPSGDPAFVIEMFFWILALLSLCLYLRKRARESAQPSGDSYTTLLKYFLAILLIDIGIIAACFFLAGIFVYQAALFLLAMIAGILASIGYFVTKARSLGFVPAW